MLIAVHIPFYYNESRIKYLEQVLRNMEDIGASHDLTIYLYCNRRFAINREFKNIKINHITKKFPDFPRLRGHYRRLPFRIRQYVDPLYLSWAHRKVVLDTINDYDIQIFIDDDAGFTAGSFRYWLSYGSMCNENGYNLGFLRTEFDERAGKWFCTDLLRSPRELVRVGDRMFARSVHFYGLWIYDKAELKRFAESARWYPRHGENVIERAEIGWHADYLNMYKGTIVPVKNLENGSYIVDDECGIHHMPNNYIGHPTFCTLEFPPRVVSE